MSSVQNKKDGEEKKVPESVANKTEVDKSNDKVEVNEAERSNDDEPSKKSESADQDVAQIFPQRLMDILDKDEEHGEIISWLPHGRGFMIYNKKIFETKIMPKYFPTNSKFTSFNRKLNRWGFARVTRGPEMGAYYHKFFKRGEVHLCMSMSCQRPSGNGIVTDGVSAGDGGKNPMLTQTAMQQNGAGFNLPGNQNSLQMQQQHMQLLMRHREQMMQQREALLNRSIGGQGAQQSMTGLQIGQMRMLQMMAMQQAASGGPAGKTHQVMGMPGMMARHPHNYGRMG